MKSSIPSPFRSPRKRFSGNTTCVLLLTLASRREGGTSLATFEGNVGSRGGGAAGVAGIIQVSAIALRSIRGWAGRLSQPVRIATEPMRATFCKTVLRKFTLPLQLLLQQAISVLPF